MWMVGGVMDSEKLRAEFKLQSSSLYSRMLTSTRESYESISSLLANGQVAEDKTGPYGLA